MNGYDEYETIAFERDGRILKLTINRPDVLNAMHPPMAEELCDAWERVRDDDDIWVGVLTGSGERAFSAGADLKWRAEAGEAVREQNREEATGAALSSCLLCSCQFSLCKQLLQHKSSNLFQSFRLQQLLQLQLTLAMLLAWMTLTRMRRSFRSSLKSLTLV